MDPLAGTLPSLRIRTQHWLEMKAHVTRQTPEEACGLLAGLDRTSQAVFQISNLLRSPVRFKMDPQEQLSAFLEIEQRGWDLLAIYHSHPTGPNQPSPTDIAEAYYPEAVSLIWYQEAGDWDCRAFTIVKGQVAKIDIEFDLEM